MRTGKLLLLILCMSQPSWPQGQRDPHEQKLIDLALGYENGDSENFYRFLDDEERLKIGTMSILHGPGNSPAVWKRTYDIEIEKKPERTLASITALDPDDPGESISFDSPVSELPAQCNASYFFQNFKSHGNATFMKLDFLLYAAYQGVVTFGNFCKVGILYAGDDSEAPSTYAILCRERYDPELKYYDGYRVFEILRDP